MRRYRLIKFHFTRIGRCIGLESLPLAPAAQFHQNQQKANLFDQFIYTQSQCSHGPNLANGFPGGLHGGFPAGFPSGQHSLRFSGPLPAPSHGLPPQSGFAQLQTVYGVPSQSLDVSQSSGFEIAQHAQQDLLTSYGPPASGSASSIDALIQHTVPEVNSPSSSYGPPPSGDPKDLYAHSSQKSLSTIQVENSNESSQSNIETSYNQLPGLDGAGLDIISAQKSHTVEIPVQGQLGTYSLQFQSADPLASQNNGLGTPDHQKLLSEGLLQSILSAIEQPKSDNQLLEQPSTISESFQNHPDVKEFISSTAGRETLAEVKAE